MQWYVLLSIVLGVIALACCLYCLWCLKRPKPPKPQPPPPPMTPLDIYRQVSRLSGHPEDKEQVAPLTGPPLKRPHRPPPLFIRQHSALSEGEVGRPISPLAISPNVTHQYNRSHSTSESNQDSGYRSRAFTYPSSSPTVGRNRPPSFHRQLSRTSQKSVEKRKPVEMSFTPMGF